MEGKEVRRHIVDGDQGPVGETSTQEGTGLRVVKKEWLSMNGKFLVESSEKELLQKTLGRGDAT